MGQTQDFYSGEIGVMIEQVAEGFFSSLQDKITLDVTEEQNVGREMI